VNFSFPDLMLMIFSDIKAFLSLRLRKARNASIFDMKLI